MGALAERIEATLGIDPTANAIEYEGRWYNWNYIRSVGFLLRQEISAAGLSLDSRIGVLLRNNVAIVPAMLEVLGSHCLVTLNPMLAAEKLVTDIGAVKVPAIIGVAEDLDNPKIKDALEETGALVIEVSADPERPVAVRQRRSKANVEEARISSEGNALEMLSSGTTGVPKRIPMRRDALEYAVFGAARFEKSRSNGDQPVLRRGVQLLMAPFSHSSGVLALLNAVVAGRSIALLPKFTVADFCERVHRHGIKAASAPPAALKMLYDSDVPKEQLASLKAFRVGTAPLDPDLADAIYERYGIPALQNYGATEFGGVAGWTIDDFHAHRTTRRGSVGRLNPGVEARVIDPDTGSPMPFGAVGILELKSKQTGQGDAWVRTTDLAKMDDQGFLWITGRADNAIIRGGFKIQPDDVVRAMEAHPDIAEAAVVGLPDPRLGQVPGAAYVVRKGADAPSAEELTAFLKKLLTGYQVPVILLPVAELPRTVSMKVDQTALKALLLSSQPKSPSVQASASAEASY